jgi:hypothetical protein
MTVSQILAYVTTMMNDLGLTPFVYAGIIIALVFMVVRWFFGRGE